MRLATPRQVLQEISEGARKPWWIKTLKKRMEEHLTKATWRGLPMIDAMLTETQCAAVIEEALNVIRMPNPGDPVGDMLRDARVMGHG